MKNINRNLIYGLMIAPSLIAILLLFGFPFLNTVRLSFSNADGFTLEHYKIFLTSAENLRSLWLAVLLAILGTISIFILSIPLALFIRQSSNNVFAKMLNGLVILPLIMPPIVSSFGLLLFWRNNGWFNLFVTQVLGKAEPISVNFTIQGLVIFYIWIYIPYTLINAISAIRSINPEIENAARVSGANRFQVFSRVTLPLMMPGLISGSILTFIMAFGAFTVPLIAGGDFRPISVRTYTIATVFNQWNLASAMSVIMAMVQFFILFFFMRYTARRKNQ